MSLELGAYHDAVIRRISQLEESGFGARLWRRDPSLWSDDAGQQSQISQSLGWLDVAGAMAEKLDELSGFAAEVRGAGFKQVVHMGMGGSSLAPLVMERALAVAGGLPLTVLDTTDPATILALGDRLPLVDTLFIVASKSGATAEPLAFMEYFFDKVKAVKGERAGENFVAITDPGTQLEKTAAGRGFRRTFLNFTDIGGRYSALTYFGLAPAALAGVDVGRLLSEAMSMQAACGPDVPIRENPGVVLGAVMGEMGLEGRDKVTFLMSEGAAISALGMWLEQLLAESTGKQGTGLLPVAGEAVGAADAYGDDRLFVFISLRGQADPLLMQGIQVLKEAGQPLVNIELDDPYGLGREFIRWEIATAAAGAVMGINPFDQPNVQESKNNTNRLLSQVSEGGSLPDEKAFLADGALSLYASGLDLPSSALKDAIEDFLRLAHRGSYVAIMAYLREEEDSHQKLESIRLLLRDRLVVATTVGYGPRFLHSTGQFHKGGPDSGVFLQLTAGDPVDAPLPGAPYGFSVFKQAQALGDLESLRRHGRPVLRIHLGENASEGLARLKDLIGSALAE